MNGATLNRAEIYLGDGQSCTGTEASPLHFTGFQRDTETGLDQTWFRKYSSAQGRWLIPDPLAASASQTAPQTLNRYVYSLDSPINFSDPSGLLPDPCGLMGCGGWGSGGYGGLPPIGCGVDPFCAAAGGPGPFPGGDGCVGAQCADGSRRQYPSNTARSAGPGFYKWGWSYVDEYQQDTVNGKQGDWIWVGSHAEWGIIGYADSDLLPNGDVPIEKDIWHCPNCANTWRNASGAANRALKATAVVLVAVPVIGEVGGAVAACQPGLNTSNYGHVTVYCRAWMGGNLIGIGYDPRNGLHINVGSSIHIPLWPWW